MSTLTKFVAEVQAIDPSLAGENDKDQGEIKKLSAESETYVQDLPVTAPASQHPTHPSLLRYFLQIQTLSALKTAQANHPNSFPPLDIDIASLPIPERKAVAPVKKDKKAKAPAPANGVSEAGLVESATAIAGVAVNAVAGAATGAAQAVGGALETVKAAVVGEGEAAPALAAAGAGAGVKKKEKKEKPAKPKVEPKVETGPLPSMIDMRVGKVLDVKKHPEADSLYVEQIDVGEEEPRTVCSGLVKYMSEDEIRGATIIVICNLKPVTMRGVKSYAMLLCASSKDGKESGGVEFVLPPAGSQPGERIFFEGEKYENEKPEAQLNPKKKVFETVQPGFITLDNLDAAWVDPVTQSVHRIRTKDGVCKAKSFVGASLS